MASLSSLCTLQMQAAHVQYSPQDAWLPRVSCVRFTRGRGCPHAHCNLLEEYERQLQVIVAFPSVMQSK